jgi:response regulator RpfG family c-di-GMP phosphodiesterase
MAEMVALSHHERWDGSGYPTGSRGQEIPLSARIVTLADVYDALTTKRPYKEAFSHDKARTFILQNREKIFDPDVVDAFVANEDAFARIALKFTDIELS